MTWVQIHGTIEYYMYVLDSTSRMAVGISIMMGIFGTLDSK